MGKNYELTVDLDKPCILCGREGAVNNGLCLECLNKNLSRIMDARKQGRKIGVEDLTPSKRPKKRR